MSRAGIKLDSVIETIGQRIGAHTPSRAVQDHANAKLKDGGRHASRWVHATQLWHVDGENGRYMVGLVLTPDGRVIDAECSCPAATICWHLLYVLTLYTDGDPDLIVT